MRGILSKRTAVCVNQSCPCYTLSDIVFVGPSGGRGSYDSFTNLQAYRRSQTVIPTIPCHGKNSWLEVVAIYGRDCSKYRITEITLRRTIFEPGLQTLAMALEQDSSPLRLSVLQISCITTSFMKMMTQFEKSSAYEYWTSSNQCHGPGCNKLVSRVEKMTRSAISPVLFINYP